MKKFFTLLCALALVLSTSAAPVAKLTKASLQKKHQVAAKQVLPVEKALKSVSFRDANALKIAKKVNVAAPKAGKKHVAAETHELIADEVALEYYESDGDWNVVMYVGQDVFAFDVVTNNPDELEDGTYDLADMDTNYSGYGSAGSQYFTGGFTSATLEVSTNDYGKCYVATVTTDDGTDYVITYEALPLPEPTDFVDLAFEPESVVMQDATAEAGVFLFSATSEDARVVLAFKSTTIEGDYTREDVYSTYCALFYNDTTVKMADVTASFAEIEGGFEATVEYLGWDAVMYTITFTYLYPVAGEPIEITADMEIAEESFYGMFTITEVFAESEDGYIISMEYWGALVAGTYTEADEIDITVTHPNGLEDAIASYTLTYTTSMTNSTLTGTLIGSYGQEYIITLAYSLPEAGRQETLTITGGYLQDATATEYEAFIFAAQNAQYYVQGYVMSNAVAGDYTLNDLYVDNTYIVNFVGNDTLYFDPLAADIHVAVSGTTATITGTMLCQNYFDNSDIVEFTLNITCTIEEYEEPQGMQYDAEDEDYEGEFTEFELDKSYLAEYGSIMLIATTATDEVVLDFNLIGGAEDPVIGIPAGVYTIDDTYAAGTVTASAGVDEQGVYPSFAAHLTNDGKLTVPLWFLEDGTVTVTNVNGQLHVEVDALNSYGREIKVTIGATAAPEAIENAAAKTVATKALMNNHIVLIKNGVKFNLLGAKL